MYKFNPIYNLRRDPVTATIAAVAAIGSAGATAYSARQERKSAEKAAEAQKEIAQKQIQATKQKEMLAQETADKKLRAAQARKSQTILTAPGGTELDQEQVNLKQTFGA